MTSRIASLLAAAVGFVWLSGAALQAAPIALSDIFNTGVDNNHVALPNGVPDPHYTYGAPPPTGVVPITATSAGGFPIPPWLGDNAISAWITPAPDRTGDAGNYVYRTTFNIPVGVDLSQVYVQGIWSSDNAGVDLRLNGVSTRITYDGNFGAFSSPWTIQRGFVSGVNTLDFVVNEASGSAGNGGYTGVRVEMSGGRGPVGHVAIPGIANTGVLVPDGPPLADNALDPHFGLVAPGVVVGTPLLATAAGGFPIGPWIGDNQDSAWIVPNDSTSGPEGSYRYELIFDLTGMDPSLASIYGQWSVDNFGVDILLNGVSTGNANGNGFGGWTPFSISTAEGDVFQPGLNTLTFLVDNAAPSDNPIGLRVEFLSATVPEPGTLTLLGLGLLGVAAWRQRRG